MSRFARLGAGAFLAAMALLALAPTARADGVIIIEDPPPIVRERIRTPHFPLEVRYHRVNVRVEDQVAVTSIDQVFYNPTEAVLEGTYIFPLPEDASVDQFSLWIEGQEVQGEMLDRERARSIYENIVRRMMDPALLEYEGRGAFRARVYPIPARGERRVRISYTQLLSKNGTLVQYRYPLNTERFSAAPLQECTISVEIAAPSPIGAIYSPTHEIDMTRPDGRRAHVSYEARNVRPTQDFVLYFSRPDAALGLNTLSFRDGDERYFMLLLSPSAEMDESLVIEKDIIFVVDTSGSMAGEKMEQARNALRYCIQQLGERDRFGIVDFSTEARRFRDALVPANAENREAALAYAANLQARGGTNIDDALQTALRIAQRSETRPTMIAFLTDGLPTLGATEPQAIERRVAETNRDLHARVFVFGVGTDVNTHLLDRLAEANRGTRDYVLPGENIEVTVSAFYDKVARPIMTDLTIDFRGLETFDVYPRELPDIFYGSQVAVFGRCRGGGAHALALTGHVGGETRTMVFEGSFDGDPMASFIPRLWASRKIGYLLDQMRLHGESAEVRDEVVALATRFGIMTPYTSYLVIEDNPQITMGLPGGGEAPDPLARAIEDAAREGRRNDQGFGTNHGAATPPATPAPAEQSGAGSVAASEEFERLRQAQVAGDEDGRPSGEALIRRVGARTFYRAGEAWIESTFRPGTDVTEIRAFTDEYFQLLRSAPDLAPCLALGNQVTLEHGGRFYRIIPA